MASSRLTCRDIISGGDRKLETRGLKATVISMTPFQAHAGRARVRSQFVVADETGAVRGFAYRQPTFEASWTVKFRNFAVRDGRILFHTRTSAVRCATSPVTDAYKIQAEMLRVNPAQAYQPIADVLTCEKGTKVSFRGSVSSLEDVREIKLSAATKAVREMNIRDNTGEVTVSLWDHMTKKDLALQQRVVVVDATTTFSTYHQKVCCSINYDDELQVNDAPEEALGTLEGVSKSGNNSYTVSLEINGEDMDLTVSELVLLPVLSLEEYDEEAAIRSLPIDVWVKYNGNCVSAMHAYVPDGHAVSDLDTYSPDELTDADVPHMNDDGNAEQKSASSVDVKRDVDTCHNGSAHMDEDDVDIL